MAALPSPTTALLENTTLISQGAEAKVYKGFLSRSHSSGVQRDADSLHETPVLIKYRFTKGYRHRTLDTTLTKARVAGEARALIRCLRAGVNVPGIRMVDAVEGVLGIEWIEGKCVRKLLPGGAEEEEEEEEVSESANDDMEGGADPLAPFGVSIDQLMRLIGVEIAKMHLADIVHGDLTTSNMMLRCSAVKNAKLVLIDFGLSYQSSLVEDKAVDLYVLERAFTSTHPDSEPLFQSVLDAYRDRAGGEWAAIKRRLDDVRLRGRKRSMVG